MSAEPTILTVRNYFSAQAERYSKADAERIGPELARLMDGGKRKLEDVVEAARPDDAPLHGYFTWDDQVAAERFRQMEAGRMVRAIKVEVRQDGQRHELPAFTPIAIRVTPSASQAPVSPIGGTGAPGMSDMPDKTQASTMVDRSTSNGLDADPQSRILDTAASGPLSIIVDTRRRPAPRPSGSGPLVAAQPWDRPHPPTRQEILRGAEPVLPTGNTTGADGMLPLGNTNGASRRRTDIEQTEQFLDRQAGVSPRGKFVPEPGHTVWRDALDPANPVLPSDMRENLDKLTDDQVIGRALARLLGFEATFGGQRKREAVEAVLAPVFSAITWAVEQAGSEGWRGG